MNSCNLCAWNTIVIGKQLKLLLYIDHAILIYAIANAVLDYIKLLDGVYGKNNLLTVIQGKIYKCLRMTIDFRAKKCSF